MNTFRLFLIALFSCFMLGMNAQDEPAIEFYNASFEDFPRNSVPPRGWYDCGKPGETPPDTQPGSFEVRKTANNGFTYLGMVTRDNETNEAVAQRLERPLTPGKCYSFSIFMTYSDEYFSLSRTSGKNEFFTKPVVLRIWGGNGYCDKRELLGESELVDNTDWKEFQYTFKPKRPYKFIMLEAFYQTPTLFPYNGNLLVDDATPLVPFECDEERPDPREDITDPGPVASQEDAPCDEPAVKILSMADPSGESDAMSAISARIKNVDKKSEISLSLNGNRVSNFKFNSSTDKLTANLKLREGKNTLKISASTKCGKDYDTEVVTYSPPVAINIPPPGGDPIPPPPPPKEDKIIEDLDIAKVKEGSTIRIEQLNFKADSAVILDSSTPVLSEIYSFLRDNKNVKVEIGGHTNGLPSTEYCNWLSSNRAKEVTKWLVEKGIDKDRILAKGYGKTKPIATNKTADGRRQNQRVEIKILSLRG